MIQLIYYLIRFQWINKLINPKLNCMKKIVSMNLSILFLGLIELPKLEVILVPEITA
jgi:hypothetical protein